MKKRTKELVVKFLIFCDYALVSKDGKLSIIGEFDQLFSSEERAVLGRGFLVIKLKGEVNEESEIEVWISKDPKADPLIRNKFQIKLDSQGNCLLMLDISGLSFNEPGLYLAQVKEKDRVLGEGELTVTRVNMNQVAVA